MLDAQRCAGFTLMILFILNGSHYTLQSLLLLPLLLFSTTSIFIYYALHKATVNTQFDSPTYPGDLDELVFIVLYSI